MSWTKKQLIDAAFEEIGIGSYQYDIQPEMYSIALNRLDSMIASWFALGVNFNYTIPANQSDSDITTESGVPDYTYEAIYQNLALKLSPIFGKVITQELKQAAFLAFRNLINKDSNVPQMQLSNTIPSGAGNKLGAYWTTLNTPETRVSDSQNEIVDFN